MNHHVVLPDSVSERLNREAKKKGDKSRIITEALEQRWRNQEAEKK